MSIAAQADDAAALIEELGIAPAVVFGTSGGGDIALELVARWPGLVRGAIVHEPALIALGGRGRKRGTSSCSRSSSWPRPIRAARWRPSSADTPPTPRSRRSTRSIRERILGNGTHFFSQELAAFGGYIPDAERLRASHVPVRMLVSQDGSPQLMRATARFAEQLGLTVAPISGHHAPYLQRPEVFAEELRPIVRQLSRMHDVNGIRLYCEQHGRGVPILCIHGAGGTALAWADAIDELARLGRVIGYDRRGCARSERPASYERTSVGEHADDAAALLDALAIAEPAVVVGRSYGGTVATDLALRYPDRVRALVLLEPDAPRELAPAVAAWVDALADRLGRVAAREGVDAVAEALICEVAGRDAWCAFPDEIRQLLTGNGEAILAELEGEWWLQADAAALATIQQPALLVAAADSPPEFHEPIEALAQALPHGRTALVAGGHLIDPAAPEVIAFIEDVLTNR